MSWATSLLNSIEINLSNWPDQGPSSHLTPLFWWSAWCHLWILKVWVGKSRLFRCVCMIFIYSTWAQCQWGSQIGRIWWWPWQCRSSEESFSCCPGILSQINWSSQDRLSYLQRWLINISPLCESRPSWWAHGWTFQQLWQRALEPQQRSSGWFWWEDATSTRSTSAENYSLSHPHPASLSSLSWPVVVLGAWGPQWTYFLFLGEAEGEKKSREIHLPSVTFGQKLS